MHGSSSLLAVTTIIFPPSESTAVTFHEFASGVAIAAGDGDSQLQRWSSLIGIITAIIGNILISFALNIQRYAHIRLHKEREERKERSKLVAKSTANGYGSTTSNGNGPMKGALANPENESDTLSQSITSNYSRSSESTSYPDNDPDQETSYLKSPYWWSGILLMTIGETGNFLAYGFAPASIVSPLGVVALISNCVIAPIMLKEMFRWRDFWGVVVAVGGAVTVVLSAKQEEKKLGPHEVIDAITTTAFEIYIGVTVALIAILMWASPRFGSKTILIDLGLVGLFGGYTALSTKGVASMLSSTLWKAFTTPITYALLAILFWTAVMQVRYVNKALQRFDSTQVIPVQFVMFTLSVILGSAVLYRDFEKTTPERAVKFVGGCLLTFFGVFLITSGRDEDGEDEMDQESDREGEERILLADHDGNDAQYQDEADQYSTMKRSQVSLAEALDGADDTPNHSRRSSRVIFAPQEVRPSSRRPTVSNTSGGESSALLENPWDDSPDNVLGSAYDPATQFIASSPSLPSESATSNDTVLAYRPRSLTLTNTGRSVLPQQGLMPADADLEVARPFTPRNSISRSMIPGPFLSPLSSSLSAVVADKLRRGVDTQPRRKSFRRARLELRRTTSGSQDLIGEPYDVLSSQPLKPGQNAADASSRVLGTSLDSYWSWAPRARAKSMSNALGDFFSKKPRRGSREDDNGSNEA